ncbi:MAG: DUF4435 domain-containing protein [Verrucomicrobia bacterium]|nr:DUF4435 domain-containing protein [Verrucomicrobiota bacterium]
MNFTRTPGGLAEKWRFYRIPTLWVEGVTDIFFFEPLISDLECRIEPFHGNTNAKALIEALVKNDYPYVIVLDGDYQMLSGAQLSHNRLIVLNRYSFENYLWEKEPLNRACLRHGQNGERVDIIGAEFDRLTSQIEKLLRKAVEADVAARRCDSAPKVLPDRVEILLKRPDEPDLDPPRIASLVAPAKRSIPSKQLRSSKKDVALFLRERRLVDLLKGHLVFGMLRLLFTKVTRKLRGAKSIVPDDALIQLIADMVWRKSPSKDHRLLKRRVRRTVKDLLPHFAVITK